MGKKGLRKTRRMSNPRYFEDYDKNNDGEINVQDIVLWGKDGRRDIQQRLARMIGSGNLPKKRPVRRARVRKVYGVPRTRWMKMKPRARRAQVQRYQRSRRAQVQKVRRKNRMVRGAVKLTGSVTPRERGRLGRTQRRQHAMLERRRRRWRIRRLGRGK